MRIERNITLTPSRRYRVRINRDYLPQRVSSYHLTLEEAREARDRFEARYPITAEGYRPAGERCPCCGK